ncbi:MAG: alpha/beta hydrolase [Proteobacteria bacterium]|nr:alpha/beta hydrolase [Pseudomonadota bacterium]
MPFVRLRDLRCYYERKGEGPRVLVLSGTGGDLRKRPSLMDSPLAERFELLCHDQRGLGQSERPDVPYSMADYAEDAAALLDAVEWPSCAVLGISFGGMVAQELAIRFPERVERLVLCCTASGGEGGSSYPIHELTDLPTEERLARFLEIQDRRLTPAWQAEHPDEVARFRALFDPARDPGAGEPGREAGARRQLEARAQHDTWDRLDRIAVPTLCCGGGYDNQAPPDRMQALARRIPAPKSNSSKAATSSSSKTQAPGHASPASWPAKARAPSTNEAPPTGTAPRPAAETHRWQRGRSSATASEAQRRQRRWLGGRSSKGSC